MATRRQGPAPGHGHEPRPPDGTAPALTFPVKTFILVGMSATYQSDATRTTLLQAAFEEFHHTGFEATSLDAVITRAGVTKGALYHHFPSKGAVGYAVLDEVLDHLVQQFWVEPLQGSRDPVSQLIGMMGNAVASMEERDLLLGCPLNNLALEMSAVDAGFRTRINRIYDTWRNGVEAALRHGQACGTVRSDIEPAAVAWFVVGSLSGCRGLSKSAQSLDALEACVNCLAEYLNSLRPR